ARSFLSSLPPLSRAHYPLVLIPDHLEVLPGGALIAGIAQQRRRMEGSHHLDPISVEPAPMDLGYPGLGVYNCLGRSGPQTDNDTRSEKADLSLQIGAA